MTKLGEGAGAQLGPEPDVARPDPRQVLAALADDGPDEMGRDLAGAADVVEATLIEVGHVRPRLEEGGRQGHPRRSSASCAPASKSGTSPETLAAARKAADAGCAVVAVTADQTSPLASMAALAVPTPIGEEGGARRRRAIMADKPYWK